MRLLSGDFRDTRRASMPNNKIGYFLKLNRSQRGFYLRVFFDERLKELSKRPGMNYQRRE